MKLAHVTAPGSERQREIVPDLERGERRGRTQGHMILVGAEKQAL